MIIYDPKITGSFQINGSTISSVGEIDNLSGSVAALNNASSSYLLNTTDVLNGNLTVTGTLTAQEFHTEYTSASIVYQSGSTKFGDSSDDIHEFTGNVGIGVASPNSALEVDGNIYLSNNNNFLLFGTTSNIDAYIQSDSTQNLYLGSRDTSKLFVSSSGNVGIGTTSPASRLHTYGSSQGVARFESSQGEVNIALNNSAASGNLIGAVGANFYFYSGGSERMRIDSSGRVGIGVTPSTWSFNVLQIKNSSVWTTGNDLGLNANSYYDGSNYRYIAAAATSRIYHNTDGSINFSNAPTGTAGAIATFNERMKVNADGSVTFNQGATAIPVGGISHYTNNYLYIKGGTAGGALGNDNFSSAFYALDNGDANIIAGSSNALVVKASGNVGIGNTNPDSLLQIGESYQTTAGTNKKILANMGGYYSTNTGLQYQVLGFTGTTFDESDIFTQSSGEALKNFYIGLVADGGYFNANRFSVIGGGSEIMSFKPDSKYVGIGVTSPGHPLEVNGIISTNHSSNTSGLLIRKASSTIGFIGQTGGWEGNTNSDLAVAAETGKGIYFYTNGSAVDRVSISTSGVLNTSQKINIASYTSVGQTTSGAMSIFGHNVEVDTSAANTIRAKNTGYFAQFMKMYYNQGITFHVAPSTVTAADIVYDPTTNPYERMRITNDGETRLQGGPAMTGGWTRTLFLKSQYPVIGMESNYNNKRGGIGFDGGGAGGTGIWVFWTNGGSDNISAGTPVLYASTSGVENYNGSYGTISDERVKENIIDASPKLNDILSLNVKNYNLIGDSTKQIGFVAQEFEQVFPSLVTTKDTRHFDDEGNIISGLEDAKSLKVGMEFAILTKAIQEQQAIIEDLKARIQTLENS